MGNKPDKLFNSNYDSNQNNAAKIRINELISNYLISDKNKILDIKKIIKDNNRNKSKKYFEKSRLNQSLNSNNFIDFSLLLANQIQIKALEKDLNFNFGKNFLLNSHAIQLCSVEDVNENILFDNKSALLQMNAYDKRFNEEFTEKFIEKEIKKFNSFKNKIKDELQFVKEMDEEIKNLRKSNEYSSDLIEKENDEKDNPHYNNNFIIKRDDLSLQEYLNIETKRLKKDRSKLSESMRMINKNNEDIEEYKEQEELIVYKNFEDKDLDLRIEKKGYKFEKKGSDVDTNYDYMNSKNNFKNTNMKNSKEKFFTSKHDDEIQKIYMKESGSNNFNITNTSKFNKSGNQALKNSDANFSNSPGKNVSPNKTINFNLMRNKHLEKNNKNHNSKVIINYNYNSNNNNNQNNLNVSVNKGKPSSRNNAGNTNKSIVYNDIKDIDNNSNRKPIMNIRKNSANVKNDKNIRDQYSIKTDYISYINNRNFSDKKNSINNNNYSNSNKKSENNNSFRKYNNYKNKSSSSANLNFIPNDLDLLVSNNYSKSNKNSGAEKIEFPNNNKKANSTRMDHKPNLNNNINDHFDLNEINDSKEDLINNHYSKDLDKIFNIENDKIYEKPNNLIMKKQGNHNLNNNKNNINFEEDMKNVKNYYNVNSNRNIINDFHNNNLENLIYNTENNNDYEKSNVNLNTSQNKINKHLNTSINMQNNKNNTSRNVSSKYNFTSFNQTIGKNTNSNNNLKLNNRFDKNVPTMLLANSNNNNNQKELASNYINNQNSRKNPPLKLHKTNNSIILGTSNNPYRLNNQVTNTSTMLNTTNKFSKTPSKPSIRIDIRELMKKEIPEIKKTEKIIEDCEDNDHEKSNGNLIIENINANNQVNTVDFQIFEFLNKMKNNNIEIDNKNFTNNHEKNHFTDKKDHEVNKSNDSLDNLIIKNQKELINNQINKLNNQKNLINYNNNYHKIDYILEEESENNFINYENKKEINNSNIVNNSLNKSISRKNIKLKIDENDDIIVEEEY